MTGAAQDPAAVFVDLVRVETRLFNEFAALLKRGSGIATGQWDFLRFIEARGAVRVQDIAGELAITIGAVSKAIDRLVARGLVIRRPHPQDRRSQLISITPEGAVILEKATAQLERAFAGYLGRLSPARRAAFTSALAELNALTAAAKDTSVGDQEQTRAR